MFVVESFNYPDSDTDLDFDPMTTIHKVDPYLLLITEKNNFLTPPVEEDIFSFVHDNLNDTSISHSQSFYDQMLPSFREAANMVRSNKDVQKFHVMMASFIGDLKEEYNNQNQNPNHTYISSNIPCERATKHYGCNSYKRRKT